MSELSRIFGVLDALLYRLNLARMRRAIDHDCRERPARRPPLIVERKQINALLAWGRRTEKG
jgi:hypothetical protein